MNMFEGLSIENLEVSKWLNVKEAASKTLSQKVVAIHAFQMLCPGCVLHGVPQANRFHQYFNNGLVQILGLHTVFEHHEAMQEISLIAFLHEFRITFPVGIDAHKDDQRIPLTMSKFNLQGTPSWLLFNKQGRLCANLFGRVEDLVIASMITQLIQTDTIDKMLLSAS